MAGIVESSSRSQQASASSGVLEAAVSSPAPSENSVEALSRLAVNTPSVPGVATIGATGDIYAVVNLGGAFDFGKPHGDGSAPVGSTAPAQAAASVILRIAP